MVHSKLTEGLIVISNDFKGLTKQRVESLLVASFHLVELSHSVCGYIGKSKEWIRLLYGLV